MSSDDMLVAGMWGTSNLKLFLIDSQGKSVAEREGPGASKIMHSDFESTLFELAGDWLTPGLTRDIILAGMVGSTIGWVDTPYTQCPIGTDSLALSTANLVRGRRIHIIHGLACANIFNQPDVMRGEETEIVGLLGLDQSYNAGEHLICIPGTHAKWARLRDGQILDFMTSVSGELFAGLIQNGILVNSACTIRNEVTAAYRAGVVQAQSAEAELLHQLFTVRARQVYGKNKDGVHDAVDRLSGLIIGSDVSAALSHSAYKAATGPVTVIGNAGVTGRYREAIKMCGRNAHIISAQETAVSGFKILSDVIQANATRT